MQTELWLTPLTMHATTRENEKTSEDETVTRLLKVRHARWIYELNPKDVNRRAVESGTETSVVRSCRSNRLHRSVSTKENPRRRNTKSLTDSPQRQTTRVELSNCPSRWS